MKTKVLGSIAALGLVMACGAEGDGGGSGSGGTSGGLPGEADTAAMGTDATCVPGQPDCRCLGGACQGTQVCIMDVCVPGPAPEVDEGPGQALAGMTVDLPGDGFGETFVWEQIAGPGAEIERADQPQGRVFIPATVAPGSALSFRLTATASTVSKSVEYEVQVLEPNFEEALGGVPMEAMGTPFGFVAGDGLWVFSIEGLATRFDGDGLPVDTYMIDGTPQDVRSYGESIAIANSTAMAVQLIDRVTGDVSTLVDGLSGGEPLGTVRYLAPFGNDRLFISNDEGQIILHDASEDGIVATTVALTQLAGTTPTAMALGPEADDEEPALYVGTATGTVLRLPLMPMDQDMPAEIQAEDYVSVGSGGVTGLEFDEYGNLWAGSEGAGSLYIVRRPVEGAPSVARQFSDAPAGLSGFTNLRIDNGTIMWASPSGRSIGRLLIADN